MQDTTAKKLVLPATVQYGIYLSEYEIRSFTSKSLEFISADENNPAFASYDGILYSKDFSRIYSIPANISEITLKPIEIMEKNTLTSLPNLRTLKIGEGTKELQEDAIENCRHLEKVYIPDSVTTIEYKEINGNVYEAFSGCPDNFVVYASAGSAGEAYARKKGLACKDPKELFPADYSKIDELLKSIPQDLSLYTSDSVSRLNQAIDSIDRSYNAAQQKLVDAMADTLKSAINNLELRPADYSKIDSLLKNVPQDLSLYTSDSVSRLNQAIDSIDRSYNAAQQKFVDAMANTLESAINNLELRPVLPDTSTPSPAKVTGLKITYKKSGKVILNWKKIKNASGYEIYRYQNKKWVKVKKLGKKTSFVIKKRSKKTVYYRVRAFRKEGKNISYGKYSKKIKCKAKK